MGVCNFCTLRGIRRRAKKRGLVVTLRPGPDGDGDVDVDVHVHEKGQEPRTPRDPDNDPTWAAWFMALGTRCEC